MISSQTLHTTPTSTQNKPASATTTFRLTDSTYYTPEANQHYQSASMFKEFQSCEARAMAKLAGWEPENKDPTALLAGNYVHSYFESQEAHERFIKDNPVMFTKSGSLKAAYKTAQTMIDALKDDKHFTEAYMPGEKELILTGDIGGVQWMGKLDSYMPGKAFFMDIKTTQDIHKRFWVPDERRGHWGSFVEAYNYPLQMAVYQELIFQTYDVRPEPIIVAVTKQEPPDKAFIAIPQEYLDTAMSQLLEAQDRVEAVRSGQVPPKRCEQCEYCRETKHLGAPISMTELIE